MTSTEVITASVRNAVLQSLSEKYWLILKHRYSLDGAEHFTLQEIGDSYGVTRERVRQIEAQTLEVVVECLDSLASTSGPTTRDPIVGEHIRALNELCAETRHTPLLSDRFEQRVRDIFAQPTGDLDPLALLLARLQGIAEFKLYPKKLGSVWAIDDSTERADIALRVRQLHTQLTRRSADPFTEMELADAINARVRETQRITLWDIRLRTDLCRTIERLPDGRLQGRMAYLTRLRQVERVMKSADEPLPLTAIAERINRDSVSAGRRPIKSLNLGNQLAASGRFVPIGRSGLWSWAEWDDVETGTVLELMERCLVENDRPMTCDEVYEWVVDRRPVSSSSISAYLGMSDRFAKSGEGFWILEHWPSPSGKRLKRRSPRRRRPKHLNRVREFARQVIIDRPSREMQLIELRDRIMQEFSFSKAAAYYHISHIEELVRSPEGRGLYKSVRWIKPVEGGSAPQD